MSKLFDFLAKLAESITAVERSGKQVVSIDLNSASYDWLRSECGDAGLDEINGSIWGIPFNIDNSLPVGETLLHF